MARFALTANHKITLGVLIVFSGICILLSTYYKEKKFEVFDEMNELYYEQLVELDAEIEELETEEEVAEEPVTQDPTVPEEPSTPTEPTTQKTTKAPIDYTKYYVGYLSIPKLELKKGFTDINNKYNNVNRNIQVMRPSDYPDVVNGNFIIASHSGNTSVSFFKNLYKLALEDEVYITYKDTDYKYIIKNIYTVPKTGSVAINRSNSKTTLTLITCTKGDKTTQTVYIAER